MYATADELYTAAKKIATMSLEDHYSPIPLNFNTRGERLSRSYSEDTSYARSFYVPHRLEISMGDVDYQTYISERIEDCIREIAGEIAIDSIKQGVVTGTKWVIETRPDYDEYSHRANYLVRGYSFAIKMADDFMPQIESSLQSKRAHIDYKPTSPPKVSYNPKKDIVEWMCGHCQTPNDIPQKLCTQCGAPRAKLLHELK